ncbi:hypothetical protein [Dethiosulfatarculus sandiegensis]|uniref:Uncharacterized protein n=1 Tax=Dethiosulfatarculus sandiegensis TaxID=1429043 RepID=A0A0D2JHM3_9BACT|nr:hypothetical protein [Dethiosulfatarculus sandiegensis]KIX15256.1 hypothetical protein X474_03365 [Dethiosulfatarculus sandiegensis]
MTHTLHRLGTDEELLKEDFVLLAMPSKDINHVGSAPKLKEFFAIALDSGAIKIGDCRSGNEYYQGGLDKVLKNVEDRAVIHAVFSDLESLKTAMKKLKEADLGISIVASGLFDQVKEACECTGLTPHTINQSLGRWGKTEKLPKDETLEVQTMCGHGMVSVNLIKKAVEKVASNKATSLEAAEQLFKPCMCGIFNPHRAAKLIERLAEKKLRTKQDD